MDLGGGEANLADAVGDGLEQCCSLAGPARERRAVDLDPLGRHHLGLAIERQVVIELGDHDVRERGEGGLAACDRLHRRRGLDDLLTRPAAVLRPHRADDPPMDRHGIKHLVAVLTEQAERAATIGASAASLLRLDAPLLARQMRRQ